MPFYGIYGQFGIVTIKVKGFHGQLRLGSEFAPGSGEGKEYVDDNVGGSSLAKNGRDASSTG
jgi:hypothetical protein